MKKLILLLLLVSPAFGAIAFQAAGSTQKACGTTGTCNSGSLTLTIGDTEVVFVSFYNGQSNTPHVTSVTDTQGDTYSQLGIIQASNGVFTEAWYTPSIASTNATGTVTVNYSPTGTGTSSAISWLEYSGVAAVNLSNVQTNSGSAVTSSSLTITTSNANNFVVGGFSVHPATTQTVSGCTSRGATTNGGGTANLLTCDATSVSPAAVTIGTTFSSASWSGIALELCTVNPCVTAAGGRIRHQVITGE